MKKILYSTFALGMLSVVSCSDDNTPVPNQMPSNAVSYEGKTFGIDTGKMINWGAWENHYNYDLLLTDGVLDIENQTTSEATAFISAELWSPGTESFTPGTFNFDDSGETAGKHYFENSTVYLDTNNNGELDDSDTRQTVKAGTFKVVAEQNNTTYRVEMSLTLENNKKVSGTYRGDFAIIDGFPIELE